MNTATKPIITYRKVRNCACGPVWALYVNKRITITNKKREVIVNAFWKAHAKANLEAWR